MFYNPLIELQISCVDALRSSKETIALIHFLESFFILFQKVSSVILSANPLHTFYLNNLQSLYCSQ
jgi:hypothetical protein